MILSIIVQIIPLAFAIAHNYCINYTVTELNRGSINEFQGLRLKNKGVHRSPKSPPVKNTNNTISSLK